MKTLEKMTSHSAKIPIKSLAEYCFFTSSWHCKAPKTFKIYLQDVLLLLPFSSTMLCFFTQGESWQSSTAGETLTRDKYLTQPHIRRPRLSLQGINTKKNVCVSKYIDVWIATGPENWVLRIFLSTFYSWEWSFMGYICWEMKRNNKSYVCMCVFLLQETQVHGH